MSEKPDVSIIISAYNRPQVVTFAIRSVVASDFADWELIVVGDGCNAETEAAVRAFTDPRIRFHNLPANTGHQSAPHNKGVELARGEFVLFLNQDDMYFPDHISRRVAFMRETGADVSWSPILLRQRSGLDHGSIDVERDKLTLDGATADGDFDPESFVISSCWAVRREVCDAVGPWLSPSETRLSPSQEWLHRANERGRRMAYHPYVSVLCIHSGVRRYSYLFSDCMEHERAWSWLAAGPEERLNLMHAVAVHGAADFIGIRKQLARREHAVRSWLEGALQKFGVHPHSTQRFFEGLTKGEWVGNHTRFTSSMPPLLPLVAQTHIGDRTADAYLGRGWHGGEKKGRWTSGATAELFFTIPEEVASSRPCVLEICGYPLRDGDAVTFQINGEAPVTKDVSWANQIATINLPDAGAYRLTLSVEAPTSPFRLGDSNDRRILGFRLGWVRLTPRDGAA